MQTALKTKLSVFMFLQYFIWGAWYMSLGTYLTNVLKFSGQEVGAAYGAFAIGSMISPFFVGLIADRYFSSEKLLAGLGVLGGVVMCLLPQTKLFREFYPMLILYCALFAPTLALGNSLSLHHLMDSKTDFPRVKIWSAVGWIGGGVTLSLLKGEQSAIQFYLAGGASIALGIFSLMLPHTPPKKVGQGVGVGEVLGLDALALMKRPAFAIFIACLFLICIPLYFYFVMMSVYLTELKWEQMAAKMSLAQVSDVIFLFLLPIMLKNLGYKKTIGIGILAWAVRYYMLAGSVNAASLRTLLILGAILLHGVCYDFLFIAGQLYVDSQANERIRGASQGFIAFILWGVGSFVGTMLAGKVLGMYAVTSATGVVTHNWQRIWMTPAIGASAVLVIFLIFFREPGKKEEERGFEVVGADKNIGV
ncbi:MAG TPA: MFS transporter [Tepidisphaeraceae bacterium]|jgi:nucleoside transporter|nr:MFS transporter [Tepidisphaeraceae bacterium]